MGQDGNGGGTALPPTEVQYNAIYEGQAKSPTLRRIWAEVYGDDYPADADPFSFVTLTDLRRIVQELGVSPSQTFADWGCGRGGPGIWIARQTGAALVGIDLSPVAVRHAQQRAQQTDLHHRVRFQQGTFAKTGWDNASLDGIISVDALLFAPEIPDAFREAHRILRPGARFVFTTWERFERGGYFTEREAIPDYRPLLEEAGLTVEVYEETPEWEARQRAIFAGIVAAKDQLIEEAGEEAAGYYYRWAVNRPQELSQTRRILAVARRQDRDLA